MEKKKSKKGTWPQAILSLFFSITLVLSIRWLLIEAYVIPSGSMFPTLLINDHIFVNKLSYGVRLPFSSKWIFKYREVERGDIVVFKYVNDRDTFFVKRVIGVAGDAISYNEKSELRINGELQEKQILASPESVTQQAGFEFSELNGSESLQLFRQEIAGKSFLTLTDSQRFPLSYEGEVPKGHLFVMGDNRDNSSDSRVWGFVPVEDVLGEPLFVWLSCRSQEVHMMAQCAPDKIRWGRFGHSVD